MTERKINSFKIGQVRGNDSAVSLSLILGSSSYTYLLSSANHLQPLELGGINLSDTSFNNDNEEFLQHLVNAGNLNRYKYNRIDISIAGSDFTLLPQAFGQEQALKELLQFVVGKENKRHLNYRLNDVLITAGFDQDRLTTVERFFPSAHIRHIAATTLALFFNHPNFAQADMFISLNGVDLEICVKANNKLVFYNLFNAPSKEDVLYYLLFAMEQYHLQPAQTRLVVAADQLANSELIALIKKYIKHVNLCTFSNQLTIEADFLQVPAHHHFQLFHQYTCE